MTITVNSRQASGLVVPTDTRSLPEQIAKIFAEPKPTRSALNVLAWKSYLPDDCIESMIYLGWDRST